jgi:purine nucleosidase
VPTATRRIILDTDPGIDDALAILLALASPELCLEALTVTVGNCSTEQGVINALSVLELAGATHIPVAPGLDRPLLQPLLTAPETHGSTGLGYAQLPLPRQAPVKQHAVDLLIERIMAAPGEITLVAVAPLTNLALAVRREPALVEAVHEVIIMGGAIRHEGNTTPLAEFNTYVDPHAAHIVFHSGLPITLVPLDVTYQCILTQTDVDRLLALDAPLTRFVADSTRFYMEFHDEYQDIQGCVSPLSLGKTMADFYRMWAKPPNMQVALKVQPRRFIELFLERIENLARRLS